MSPAQTSLYWREWAAVVRRARLDAAPEPDRHAIHAAALGAAKSSKQFTNADLDRVLAEFRALSQPHNLNAQVRQQDQPRARKLGRIEELLRCLALYPLAQPMGEAGALAFAREIIRDKFNHGSRRAVSEIDDLSDHPRTVTRKSDGLLIELPSHLDQLIMTLSRALNGNTGFRNQAGHTLHDMLNAAGLRCACKRCCTLRGTVLIPTRRPAPAPAPAPEPEPELVSAESNTPF